MRYLASHVSLSRLFFVSTFQKTKICTKQLPTHERSKTRTFEDNLDSNTIQTYLLLKVFLFEVSWWWCTLSLYLTFFLVPPLFQKGNGGGDGSCAPFLQFPLEYFRFHLPPPRSTFLDGKRQIVTVSRS